MKLIDILTSPWAIRRDKIQGIVDIYNAHIRGPKLDFEALESKILSLQDPQDASYEVINGKAVIPVKGVLSKNPSAFMRVLYGASSTVKIREAFLQAVNDPEVDEILLDIDSPGGSVDGTQELANAIFENRGKKPVTAFTDGMIASAAYWIGSAADKIYISGDTVEIGSIGVVMVHMDFSEQDKKYGVNVTEIYAGKYKRAGSPNKPLSKEEKAYLQGQIDYLYSIFVNDVARNRNESVETVLKNMADGRIFIGTQAIDAGLADGVSARDLLINNTGGVPVVSKDQYSQADAGSGAENAEDSGETENITEKEDTVDIQTLEMDHPAVFQEAKKLGAAEAEKNTDDKVKSAADEARQEGAQAELDRIKAVKEQLIPGHEALIESLMFDGHTTGDQAAAQVVKAEKEKNEKVLENIQTDSPGAVDSAEPETKEPEPKEDQRPVEEQAKAEWEKDSKLRAEFVNNFDSYLAYIEASRAGNAKILGHREGK